jgi:eukaryotic-like serine/threonine-protein kinase
MPDAVSAEVSRAVRSSRCSEGAPSVRPLERDERLGPYRICFEVAAGGMATVYLARSRAKVGVDRFVALKVVHPHLARDTVFVDMFADEARIASLIKHPNVCRVLDFDRDAREPYLALEYLHGENLASVFGRIAPRLGAAKPAEELDLERHARLVARATADACAGLHAAHELCDEDGTRLEVVHRDVSPENLFLTYEGVVKIVDFGVAQASRQRHRTSTGFVKGKLAYLQPEALENKPIDRRADVWGLGVTMWELLTGRRLFRCEGDLDTLRAIGEREIRPPSEVVPGLPRELDAIVLRALTRDPGGRYATTRDMARDLLDVLASGPSIPDSVELAEWMDDLFPGGREREHRLELMAERIAGDWAVLEEREQRAERLEHEPTRPRKRLPAAPPPIPPSPSPWPITPRRFEARRRGAKTMLAAVLGAGIGALGVWYGIAPSSPRAAWPQAAPGTPADADGMPSYRPTAEVLVGQDSSTVVPLDVSRVWEDRGSGSSAKGRYAFDVGVDAREIVLRFHPVGADDRASGEPAPEADVAER